MPFTARSVALTVALAGDVGFGPLGFAKSEAEIKHARLVIPVTAGWPLADSFIRRLLLP